MRLILIIVFLLNCLMLKNKPLPVDMQFDFFKHKEKCLMSVMKVESGFYEKITGKNNDVGCLQITPVMVREANRILRKKTYNNNDRFNFEKSVEIFFIVQNYHNPGFDLKSVCKIWNPKAGNYYFERVYNEYLIL